MINKIKVMKDMLANKIAAGEIIERPLSVVKELVENSLDANATEIVIRLKASGIEYISVEDNGDGMTKDDLILSIKRHATSKIYDDKDLFKISTLGFRGEAIPSIFSVSKMTISTSLDGINGYKLVKDENDEYEVEKCPLNKGTRVDVENLFYNTPVRYKHLSTPFYELSLIIQYVNKVSLIKSNVRFILINDNNEILNTSGDGNPINILSSQYNSEIANKMLIASGKNDHFQIKLYTSHPQHTRSRKSHITIGMNGRLVRNYDIENQIVKSYGQLLHTNQFPITFIDIFVKYELVDVNVHPTKQQIKLSLLDELLKLIDETIKSEINNLSYISRPTSIKTKNVDDFQIDEILNKTFKNVDLVKEENYKYEDGKQQSEIKLDVKEEKKSASSFFSKEELEKHNKINNINNDYSSEIFQYKNSNSRRSKLPNFDYIGTYQNTYLLFQNEEGLFLVDQHAAKERINYEIILKKFEEKNFEMQTLLMPLVIELTTAENKIFETKIENIKNFGIELEEFGINTYKVVAVDNFLSQRSTLIDDIHQIIELVSNGENSNYAKYFNELAISMACKKSIKANQYVSKGEAINLIDDLDKTKSPYTCPHGRPVIVNISKNEIEKMFKRIM